MATNKPPNVVCFLTDDQGPWAMPGAWEDLVMPRLESLMDEGTTFDNFYCASPVCSPARASLLTGRMPSAHGVHDWLVGERHPDATEDQFLGGILTLPEVLNKAGYRCGMSGKWHVGSSRFPAAGYDFWYAHRLGGGYYYDAPVWSDKGERVDEPRYLTYAIAEEAVGFIDDVAKDTVHAQNRAIMGEGLYKPGSGEKPTRTDTNTGDDAADTPPFFLQLNFTAPHTPWIDQHPQDLYDIYDGCEFESIPRDEPHPWTAARTEFQESFADPVPSLKGYAASLTGVDRAIGMVLDALTRHNMMDNTIIMFMSDNGFSCGHHGVWGKGNGTVPLNFWENSVKVPLVVAGPGIPAGRRVADHVSSTGLFETVCDLAGVTPPPDPYRAGSSFKPLLTGEAPGDGSNSVVVFDEYGGGRMIRRGDWKFIDRYGDGPKELYNLVDDPHENTNLVDDPAHVDLVKELADELTQWFADHETAMDSAFHRRVSGWGQVHPPRKGYDDERSYVGQPVNFDGT